MLDFMGKIHDELGIVISSLTSAAVLVLCTLRMMNLFLTKTIWKRFEEAVKAKAKEHGLPVPYIFIEPGRSIVGEAGITLYKVGGKRKFLM